MAKEQKLLQVTQRASADRILGQNDAFSGTLHEILMIAETWQTSDIHLEPRRTGEDTLALDVRMRRSGELALAKSFEGKGFVESLVSRFKQVAGLDPQTTSCQDGAFSFSETGARYRVASMPSVMGESFVCRVIREKWIPRIAELNLSPKAQSDLLEAISQDQGIVLVTGPTGSGKSSTLQACLLEVERARWKVLAIEDPVERELPMVTHVPVTERVTWHKAIRTAMRFDPDVILIGEIRDRESASLALEAAQTGHLVLSTLHTNDAPGVVDRLIGLEVERHLIADNLMFVSAQRLESKLCPHCKRQLPSGFWTRGTGCEACFGGIKGLTPIIEYAFRPPADAIINFNKRDFRRSHLKQTLKSECERLAEMGLVDVERIAKYEA